MHQFSTKWFFNEHLSAENESRALLQQYFPIAICSDVMKHQFQPSLFRKQQEIRHSNGFLTPPPTIATATQRILCFIYEVYSISKILIVVHASVDMKSSQALISILSHSCFKMKILAQSSLKWCAKISIFFFFLSLKWNLIVSNKFLLLCCLYRINI
jgi:hypothetical protein